MFFLNVKDIYDLLTCKITFHALLTFLTFVGLQNISTNFLDFFFYYRIVYLGFNLFGSLTIFLDFLDCKIVYLGFDIFYENYLL